MAQEDKGTVFVSSYGAIHEINLNSNEEIIIDNSHLVAWDETLGSTI
ncbi:AIM24 family protein [Clostridium butyricum]